MQKNSLKLLTKNGLDMTMAMSQKSLVSTKSNPFVSIDRSFNSIITVETTPQPRVSVYKVQFGNCLDEWLDSFGKDHLSLCVAEKQIAGFCKVYKQWLSADPVGTFFIFQAEEKTSRGIHFAQVIKKNAVLSVYHGRYSDRTEKFDNKSDIRIVIPFFI